ncbi:MAG: SusC/RagA family TonB-linked outer membrane protein [Dysgonomonas sp.]
MKFKLIGTLFLLLSCTLAFAQNTKKQISGIVRDGADNSPIPATVVASGQSANVGAFANEDGEFTISAYTGDTLTFSLMGYKTVKEVVGNRNVLDIIMYIDENQLDEVTVVAFGTQKKESVIASIETVNLKDLQIPASNLTAALAGRIPGLISYQTTGEPGADNAQFFVRGVTTFGYKANPLILIDNVEATTDDLARLQPDDIESFSILKDASATVFYGARGANGIIIVNTKSGIEGPVKLSARVDFNMAKPTRTPQFLDGVEYMKLYNEARITRDPTLGAYYSGQKIQSTVDGLNPMIYPNVNWYDELFKQETFNTKANINVSGGGQVATYYVAGGFDHETGLLNVDNRNNFSNNININRIHVRTNVIFKLTPTTTLDTRIQGRFERYTGPLNSTKDLYNLMMNSNPVDFPAYFEPDEKNMYADHILFGNTFASGSLKGNPYAFMINGYENRDESIISAQGALTQDLGFITKGLTAKLTVSTRVWNKYAAGRGYAPYYYELQDYDQITEKYTLFPLNPTTGNPYLGDVMPVRNSDQKTYFEALFTWGNKFGSHNFGAMTVFRMEENILTTGQSTSIYETLPEKNMGNSGRLTYDFDSRYFLELGYGYNGSEKFSGSKRYGFFPSVAVGWMVSNEKIWEKLNNKTFSSLKFKASLGKVGNDAIAGRGDRFFYLSDVQMGSSVLNDGYRWGTSFMNYYYGYNINRYANPNITWEVSTKRNIGIEAGFLKDALKVQADFFGEDRKQIYMKRENFPATAGLEAKISGNVGRVKSSGMDASIDYQHFFNQDLWLTGRGNFTYATNEFVELDEKNYPDEYLKRKGHNINQQWGLVAERLFVDEEEIKNSPKQNFDQYMAGDIKYKDINGDGVIDDNDRVPLGFPTVPEVQYGFGLSAGYKNFDFSFFLQGNARVSFFINPSVGGGDDNDEGIAPFVNRRNALSMVAEDYWSETNPNVYAFWPRLSVNTLENNTRQSSWWLRDGSFLRVKQIEAGYSFTSLKKYNIQNLRLYVSTENLLTFSSFKLWDPEMGRRGLAYPPNKRFNIGVQISL